MRKISVIVAGLLTGLLAQAGSTVASVNADATVAVAYDRRDPGTALTLDTDAPVVTQDSIVQITAESQGLNRLLPAQVPRSGTFWLVQPGLSAVMAPLPCPPDDLSLPIYALGPNGQFLVDGSGSDSAVDVPASVGRFTTPSLRRATLETTLETQANAVVNLISRVQTAAAAPTSLRTMTMSMSGPPGFGDLGGDSGPLASFASTYTIDINGLWLEITNVANGLVKLNLHHGTNQVYAIQETTNLLTGWQVKTELWPTLDQTNVMSCTMPTLAWPNLFLRAQDWTGVTHGGNSTPDWWFWEYFGTTAMSDTNQDSQGRTLLYDYQNQIDPNVISFTLSYTNQSVNATGAPLQLSVTAGMPTYFAVLVDNTNLDEATWRDYTSSNFIINLGTNEGWHHIDVGLRGRPLTAYQTWEATRFKLDLTPPKLVITNPIVSLVTQPVIQLQGYCPEALANLSYDLTNAVGLATNQQIIVLSQYYDTNTLELTTNYFQGFDIPLTNGVNRITLHATDWAGNVTTTNLTYTLDYSTKTNAPTVQLAWPKAGTRISGSSFTWRGRISDPTARVSAQIVDTNGVVNYVSGRVSREGDFWIADIPLGGGNNSLSLTVTDAAGNTNTTTIPVVQSSLVLTITSAGLGQVVTGTISDTNYTIWVNGVKATNNLDGTWIAQKPNLTLDTPTLKVRAIPNSDNGGNGGGQ